MLKKLSIRHFAIIDELDLELKQGLNILSGETGAGKSIILQALGLILGGRGYSDLIRSGEEECEVSAVFESGGRTLSLRRVLSRNGKGRAWVDGEPATVAALEERSRGRVDLVSQHESQSLLSEEMPRMTLDEFGGHAALLQDYRAAYEEYLSALGARKALQTKAMEAKEREDLYRFQLREIQEADLKIGEEEGLLQDKKILAHAAKIREAVASVEGLLYSGNDSVIELAGRAQAALGKISGIDPSVDVQAKELESKALELEEISRFFQNYLNRIDFDPERLTHLEDRLDTLSRLKKKFSSTVEGLLEKQEELQKTLKLLDHFDEALQEAEENFSKAKGALQKKADALTRARKKAAMTLSGTMEKELFSLAMGKTRFEAKVEGAEGGAPGETAFTAAGVDQVRFFIAPNAGEDLKPLSLIASGGELSRILLALKGTGRSSAPFTYVFDEVDAGIGGGVAEVVGRKLKALSQASQVICITHLPQIAAFADAHYRIAKQEKERRVVTSVTLLKSEEREEEIARMLAGVKITEKARLHARELMSQVLGSKS